MPIFIVKQRRNLVQKAGDFMVFSLACYGFVTLLKKFSEKDEKIQDVEDDYLD